MEFRDAVKYLRGELGLTQVELATGLNMNAVTVGRWENGKTIPNRSITAVLLAYARAKGASKACLDVLERAIDAAAKQKFDASGDGLCAVEHASLRQLIDDASFAIYVCDMETDEILYLNQRANDMVGGEESAVGKKCYECLMHLDAPCPFCHKDELIDDRFIGFDACRPFDGATYRVQGKRIQWNGRRAQVKYVLGPSAAPMRPTADAPAPRSAQGVQSAAHADMADIASARERLAAQRRQILDLLNETPSGIAVVEVNPNDVAGSLRTTYYNDRFYRFSGYGRDEYAALLKKDEMHFVFDEDKPKLLADTEKICQGETGASVDTTVRCHTKDGGFRWLLLTGQLVRRRGDTCVINIAMVDVTERQAAIDRQRISEEMLRIAAETDKRAMIVYDVKRNACRVESRTLFASKYGDTFEDVPQSLIDRGVAALDSADDLCALFARIRSGEKEIRVSLRLRSGADEYEWFECNAATVFDADGRPDHAVLVFHNITEQRVKEAVFKKWQQSIDTRPQASYTLFRCNLSKDASLDERDGGLLKIVFPPSALSFNARSKLYADEYVCPDDRQAYLDLVDSDTLLAMFYRGEHTAELEYRETDEDGGALWRRLTVEMVEYLNSTDIQAFLMYEDIDGAKKAEIAAREIAEADPLTGALNRGAFAEKVDAVIRENPTAHNALIMLDMDGFKQLNDTFGHAAGDQALQEVVAVLRSYTRSGDLVCRLGGDEFLVWLRDVPYDAVIGKTAQQMCEHIRKAYSQEVLLSASAGIAVYPRDGRSCDELYPNADKALYRVKQAGKGSYAFFSAADEEQTPAVAQALSAVRQAPQASRGTKRRMLIADDSETNRLALANIFKDEYQIETAKNGEEAMIRLRHFGVSISVVLLDLMMPGIDGFTVLKRMQRDTDLRTIPVIIVTGDDDRATLLKAFSLGAAEYVNKPVDVDIIRVRVQSAVSKAESERLRAQNSYLMLQRDEEVKYRTVLESTGTVVIEYNWRNHVFIYDSAITKYIAGNYDHRSLWQVLLSDMVADSADVKAIQDALMNIAGKETKRDGKLIKLRTPSKAKHWFRMNMYKSVDDFGLAEKIIITFNDVHEEVLASDRLLFQATRDDLTGLYNRAGFIEQAAKRIAEREPGYYVMACIDIEKFKAINDQYGTKTGDEILRKFARALEKLHSGDDGICCRVTADNFAVLYPSKLLGSRALEESHRAVTYLDERIPAVQFAVGRYVVDDKALDVSAIYDRAVIAKNTVKDRYDRHTATFDEAMRTAVLRQQQITAQMNHALESGQFEVWLQPQYNHATGLLVGAEALARWRHPEEGLIPPAEFIPIFERNGFVYEVDKYVWERVCMLLRKWLDQNLNPAPVSVNVSRYDIFRGDLVSTIEGLVEKYGLPRSFLRLEITESAFSESSRQIIEVVQELVEGGFTVEIDDFGSGYSSLNTLKDVPATVLKLDMRFFEKTEHTGRGGSIVESVVRMAKLLGMTVIAEGVEDKDQADYLKSIGCHYIQGYYYSRPLDPAAYERKMAGSAKETRLARMETVETLNSNLFWDPKSMETLIFNSYVGGACIFEYASGGFELLRVNDQYIAELRGLIPDGAELKDASIMPFLTDGGREALRAAVLRADAQRKEASCELTLQSGAQTEYIRCMGRVIAKADSRLLYYAVVNNITEQREAEKKQAQSAERLSIIMQNVNGGVSAIEIDDDGTSKLVFHNDKYYEIYGYTRAESAEMEIDPMSFILPEDFPGVMEKVKKLKADGQPAVIDYGIIKQNGSRAQIRANASLMTMEGYGPIIASVLTDVTEQRTLEDQLRAVIDNINGGVSAVYLKGDVPEYVIVNDKYFEIIGYTREEFRDEVKNVFDIVHPDDRARVEQLVRESAQTEKSFTAEYRIIRRSGAVRHVLCHTNVMRLFGVDEPVQLAVTNDITTLRDAQEKERSLSTQMRAVMEHINGGITAAVFRDRHNVEMVFCNDGYYALYGYTKEQLETERISIFDLILPEDREKTIETVERIARERGSETYEYRCRKRDGSIIWTQTTNAAVSLEGVGDTVLLAITTDITQLRRAEHQNLEITNRLQAVMNAMQNGMTAFAFEGDHARLLFANDRYYEMHGIARTAYETGDLTGALALVYPDDRARLRELVMSATRIGQSGTAQYRIQRPDGTVRWTKVSLSVTNLVGVEGPVQVAVYADIDRERTAANQLRFLNDTAHDILAQPDTETAITGTLKQINDYFRADRTYVVELDAARRASGDAYEVCADGVQPQICALRGLAFVPSDAWFETLERRGVMVIEDVDAMDDGSAPLRAPLQARHVRSVIIAALKRDGALIGFAGSDNPSDAVEQVAQLTAVADYISVLLTRRDLKRKIERDKDVVQILMNDAPGGFLRMRIFPGQNPAIVSFNAGFCRMLDMTADEITAAYGDDAYKCLPEEDIAAASEETAEAFAARGRYTRKCRLKRKDGSLLWAMVFGRFVKGERGETFLNAYFTDITEQKTAEQQQIEMLDNLPIGAGLYAYDGHDLTAIHINKSFRKLVGRESPVENVMDALHPNDRAAVRQEIDAAVSQKRGAQADCRILCGDGSFRPFHVLGTVTPTDSGHWTLCLSYAPVCEADASVRAVRATSFEAMMPQMFGKIMECSADLAFAKDIHFRYICCSKTFAALLGLDSEREVVGKTDYELFSSDIADRFRRDDSALLSTEKPLVDVQEMIPSPDGTPHYIRTTKHLLRGDSGEVIGIYCTGRDVTEIREAFSRLKLLTDTIPGGIASFRCMPGSIETVYISDGICALTGYSREAFASHPIPILDFVLDKDRPTVHEQIELLKSGVTNLDFTVRIRDKDGRKKWVNSVAHATDHAGDAYNVSAVLTDVTARMAEQERLRLAEEEYRVASLHANRTICRYNIARQTVTLSEDVAKRLNLPPCLPGVPYERVKLGEISEETKETYVAFFERIMRGEKECSATFCKLLPAGWRWIEAHATTIFDDEGKPVSAIISYTDVTEQREKEAVYSRWQNSLSERPADSYALFRCNISQNTSYDSWEGKLISVQFDPNKHSFDERTDEYIQQCVYAEDRERFRAFLRADTMLAEYCRGHRSDTIEYREYLRNGTTRWIRLNVDLVEYRDSSDVEAYLMFEDIDEEKRSLLRIVERAQTDPLTGVLNRAAFAAQVNQAISAAKPGTKHALMMLDIDGFKLVNDVFGHGAGDQALVDVAGLLARLSRGGGLVGRLGGDEFLVFLADIPGEAAAARQARQICEMTRKTFSMSVHISSSIGIAVYPCDGEGFEALYKAADESLYRVKNGGKNGYAFSHGELAVLPNDWASAASGAGDGPRKAFRRMLIADDSQVDRALLTGMFKSDFQIETAADGATALTKLRHYGSAVSVVLLDLMMPGMDGYEVLEKMRQDEATRAIPVIVVSAEDDRATALKVIEAGASDLVTKPVDMELLRIRVKSAISRAENERLRAQNSYLSLRGSEVSSCESVLKRSGILVITLDWGKNEFTYSPAVSERLAGRYDGRTLWRALLSDIVTDTQTVQKMQQLVHDVAESRDKAEGEMTVRLKTRSGLSHIFAFNAFKEVNDFGLVHKVIMTLKEIEPAQRDAQAGK